ncbi:MAG TPA: hypothetical protein P5572_21310, partial [Phycisphaerae bacterium]|nr:hypothetical protein [Phycisphaerae bacterium]
LGTRLPTGEPDEVAVATRPTTGLAIPMGPDAEAMDAAENPTDGVTLNATSTNPLLNLSSAVTFLGQVEANPQLRQSIDTTPSLADQYDRALKIVRNTSNESIHTLAGPDDSRVDELMRTAESKSRAGDYYQASTYYGLAASLAPENPLIRLGYANSLAAAGEYITAVLNLEQAVADYPAFGFLRLDLNEFVQNPKDLDLRRADLEQRLDRREDYRLRFLLGYIEYYSGFEKFGLPNLRKAAAAAPEGSIIARFPDILESPAKYLPERNGVAVPQQLPERPGNP